jgi:quinohemoprotein ethanol dehydrogenase
MVNEFEATRGREPRTARRVSARAAVAMLAFAFVVVALAACGERPATTPTAKAPPSAAIDRERLLAADTTPGDWLTSGRDFGKTHFSPLQDINRGNATRLGFAWEYATNTTRGLEATPIVVDGVMYTSGPTGKVYALRAESGVELWAFDPHNDGQVSRYACCDDVNRGVAVWRGRVYVASLDGRLFALDAATGAQLWVADTFFDKTRGYTSTGAPEIAGNVVVIGNAGADYDARGYVSAYDLETGKFAWRFFVVPRDPALGPQEHPELDAAVKTWDPKSRWDVGGGGTPWGALVYDPQLNLLYVGTGNAALFNWHERSPSGGDNLYLSSILAINPDTGRLVWHYQETPRESWDYTSVQPMMLADLQIDGTTRKVLMHAPKNGFFYVLDRATGELLRAEKYVPLNWATHVDLKNGRPAIDTKAVDYQDGPKFVVPSGMGGHSWNPMAYDASKGLVYIPSIEGGALTSDPTKGHEYRPKMTNSGTSILFGDLLLIDPARLQEPMRSALVDVKRRGLDKSWSVLKAFDPVTGKTRWERRSPDWWDRAGLLATAGGLLFQGDDKGFFRVLDADTGAVLKEIEVGTSIMAAPMTYTVGGVQYVAVMAAWGGGGWFAPHATSAAVKRGNQGRIIAFRLDGGAAPLPALLGDPPPLVEPVPQTAGADTIAQGARLFRGSCGMCHANQPNGMTPDLRRMTPATHAAFQSIVRGGALRPRGMPQWDDVFTVEDVEAIHAYLIDEAWKLFRGQTGASPVTPSQLAH